MKMKLIVLSVLGVGLLASAALAAGQEQLKDQAAKDSYSLGFQFGRNLADKGVELDKEVLIAAIRDAFDGKKPLLSKAEMADAVTALRRRSFEIQEKQARDTAAKNLEEAKAFLEGNKKKPGIAVLPSGLQYTVLREGGGEGPQPADGVRMRYRGTLTNGAEFDNVMDLADADVPVIPASGANRGWSEALRLMKPGAKWRLYVPPDLGFGDRPYGKIPANSVLVYDLELLSVEKRGGAAGQGNEIRPMQ